MGKERKLITIDSFFKRKESGTSNDATNVTSHASDVNNSVQAVTNHPDPATNVGSHLETTRMNLDEIDISRLILTLHVSTTTSERAFSAMKIIQTRLRNRMEDDFLADNMTVYIEKEIARSFDSDGILDEFISLKERRVQFK